MQIRQTEVSELVDAAAEGMINLPLFQREFAWDRERVSKLLDSLLRSYPIGAFLIWNNVDYTYARANSRMKRCDWLVDGQQRLTALCILYNKRPVWWEGKRLWSELVKNNTIMVNIRTDEIKLTHHRVSKDQIAWVPVSHVLVLEDDNEVRLYANEIAQATLDNDVQLRSHLEVIKAKEKCLTDYIEDPDDDNGSTDEDDMDEELVVDNDSAFFYDSYENAHDLARRIESRVNRIRRIGAIPVPQLVARHPPSDMARIFTRLNSDGIEVSSADIFIALLASALPNWVKNDFRPFCVEMEKSGLVIEPSIYVKALTGHMLKTANLGELVGEGKERSITQRMIRNAWNEVKPAIVEVVRGLRGHGVLSEKIIPSKNTLVPLFVMRSVHPRSFKIDQAVSWFMAANFQGYSKGSNYLLNLDIGSIHSSDDFLSARNKLLERLDFRWKFYSLEFDRKQPMKKAYQMVLYMLLFNRGAKDWFTRDLIGSARPSGDWYKGFKPEWHHIFPKARIRSRRGQEIVNCLANLTVVNEKTNKKIRDRLPMDYFTQIPKRQLKSHMVPTDEDLWKIGMFPKFVHRRAEMITRGVNAFIRQLG